MRSGLQVEGLELTISDLVGSTGLELKVDPGIPYVYAGFAGTGSYLSSWHINGRNLGLLLQQDFRLPDCEILCNLHF